MESNIIQMVYTEVFGKMTVDMDMELNMILTEIGLKVYLKTIIQMDMEYYIILMEVDMKENGKII